MKKLLGLTATWLLVAGLATKQAAAVENNQIPYPNGVETWLGGALPPPGNYYQNSFSFYNASRLNVGPNSVAVPGFHLQVLADAQRFVHVWNFQLLGGNPFSQVILPIVDVNVRAAGQTQRRTGLGNMTVTPFSLGWHFGDWNLVAAMDINLPSGTYSRTDLANLIQNYYQFEPVLAFSYLSPRGPQLNLKLMYDFNTRNAVTKYQSGQTFHFDYALGWGFGPLSIGGVGYFITQTTDDKINGARFAPDGNRTRAFSFGPGAKYEYKHILFFANWKHEFVAENHTKGDVCWLRAALRF